MSIRVPRSPSPGLQWKTYAVVLGPGALALALALIDIGGRSIWVDEAAAVSIASQHGAALGSAMAHDGGNMLAFYALLHLLIGAFGDSTLVIRLPSAIALGLTAVFASLAGLRLGDRLTAAIAGVLSAVSVPLVFWAQNARGYAPMTAFVAGSFYAAVVLVDGRSGALAKRRALLAWIVASVLAMYCSYVAVFAIAAEVLVLMTDRRVRRAATIGLGAVVACCVPLAVLAFDRGTGQLAWLGRPSAQLVTQAYELVTSAGFTPNFHLSAAGAAVGGLTVVLAVFAVFAVFADLRRAGLAMGRGPLLVVSWVLVPIVLELLESYVTQPVFTARNLLEVVPGVALLLALLARRPGVPRVAVVLVLVVLIGLRSEALAPTYGTSPEPWNAATDYVLSEHQSGDCIAFFPEDNKMALGYYVGTSASEARSAPRPVLPTSSFSSTAPFVEDYVVPDAARLDAIVASCPRLIFVASHYGQRVGSSSSEAHYREWEALTAALRARYTTATARDFGWAAVIDVTVLSGARR